MGENGSGNLNELPKIWIGLNGEKNHKRSIEFYPDELELRKVLDKGLPFLIPKEFLFGRQPNDSYSKSKRKWAELEFKRDPDFMIREPIIVVALPAQNGLQLVVVDGHHRTRYSKTRETPSLVYTPDQLAKAFNIKNSTNFTTDNLIIRLEQDVSETYHSFGRLPKHKMPHLLIGVTNVNELPFKRFTPKFK